MSPSPRLSILVPLFNEEESVAALVQAIRAALGRDRWELILVDDGSSDGTFDKASEAASSDPHIRVVRLAKNYGQTIALKAGFDHARGSIVVTMDGDLQNDPEDIPRLVAKTEEGYDLVVGYREGRHDRLVTRKIPSWVANRLIRTITRVPIRDNGCTLKAFQREVLQELRLYSDMHRFIPALVASSASTRIAEIPVRHHPRRFGHSKYGLSRIWKVLADLLAVMMIRWYRDQPLVMFAWSSAAAFVAGLSFLAAALFVLARGSGVVAGGSMVFQGASLLWFGLAGYLLIVGLICEVAVRRYRGASGWVGESSGGYR